MWGSRIGRGNQYIPAGQDSGLKIAVQWQATFIIVTCIIEQCIFHLQYTSGFYTQPLDILVFQFKSFEETNF